VRVVHVDPWQEDADDADLACQREAVARCRALQRRGGFFPRCVAVVNCPDGNVACTRSAWSGGDVGVGSVGASGDTGLALAGVGTITDVAGMIRPAAIALPELGAGAQHVVCDASSTGHGPGSRFRRNMGRLLVPSMARRARGRDE